MLCPELETLSAFADRALDATADIEVARHLSTCPSCREHVEEMRWLNALGRSSLREIQAPVQLCPAPILAAPDGFNFRRPLALAAAIAGVVLLPVVAWRMNDRTRELRRASTSAPAKSAATVDQGPSTEAGASMNDAVFSDSSDETFERWIEPYRKMRIPLVPMEALADFDSGRPLPAAPAAAKRNGAG